MDDRRFYALLIWSLIVIAIVVGTIDNLLKS